MTTERRDEELPERWSAQRKTEVVLRVVSDTSRTSNFLPPHPSQTTRSAIDSLLSQ